jgi:histidyl-tRNA synthetase
MTFQKPKGTEDFYPAEMETRSYIFDSFRQTAIRYNYKEVSSPAFENLPLLTKKEGDEIRQQIFTLEKRSKEEFGLRFEHPGDRYSKIKSKAEFLFSALL